MVIFRLVLDLFFLFLLVVALSSVSMLAGGPVASLLSQIFFFLISITFGIFAFSFPFSSIRTTFIARSPIALGKGGISAVA